MTLQGIEILLTYDTESTSYLLVSYFFVVLKGIHVYSHHKLLEMQMCDIKKERHCLDVWYNTN
jgi:hypothetical protein